MATNVGKLTSFFEPYLNPDETLLWSGRPSTAIWHLFYWRDAISIPLSLIIGGFAIFWTWGVISSGTSLLWVSIGILFVIVGQYFIWGRYLYTYLERRQTYYAITSKRVIIVKKFFNDRMETYPFDKFPIASLQGKNIFLYQHVPVLSSLFRPPKKQRLRSWNSESGRGLFALNDAEATYDLLQVLLGQKPKRTE